MREFIQQVLSEEQAKEICSWRYDGEYAVYNFSDWDIVVENEWDLAVKEKRESEFLGILYEKELIAYGRIFVKDEKVFLGIGLKPCLCGKGYGKEVMRLLIKECEARYPEKIIAVEVRSFNQRAIRCYERIGFKMKDRYVKETFTGETEFYSMEK